MFIKNQHGLTKKKIRVYYCRIKYVINNSSNYSCSATPSRNKLVEIKWQEKAAELEKLK